LFARPKRSDQGTQCAKMLFIDLYKIPVWWSLATVGAILAASVVASLATPRTPERKALKQ
jgi:hypothetical protein